MKRGKWLESRRCKKRCALRMKGDMILSKSPPPALPRCVNLVTSPNIFISRKRNPKTPKKTREAEARLKKSVFAPKSASMIFRRSEEHTSELQSRVEISH